LRRYCFAAVCGSISVIVCDCLFAAPVAARGKGGWNRVLGRSGCQDVHGQGAQLHA
jgi:hypothetical protein